MKSDSSYISAQKSAELKKEALRLAIVVVTGLILPSLVHLIPSKTPLGPVLMPLFIPVAIAAYCLPLRSALAAAAMLPLVSMSLTGMPPAPIAVQMIVEGFVFVGVASITSARTRWFFSYLLSAFASRAVGLAYLAAFTGAPLASSATTIALGWLGLGIAAVALPVLFKAFRF